MSADRSGKLVVLSPHLDDAVLSVGGVLARHRAEVTEVWTVFTDGPDVDAIRPAWRALGRYEVRREEDQRALALLGCRPRHLGLRERIWRAPQVASLRRLFQVPGDLASFGCLAEIEATVARLLRDEPATVVLGPLGVGGHVDHVEVAVAALRAAHRVQALDRVGFYEDFYAVSERLRHRHPVTRRAPVAWRDRPGLAAPAAGLAVAALGRLPGGVSPARLEPAFGRPGWSCHPAAMSGEDEARKLEAVDCYASQKALLGPLAPALGPILARGHQRRGGEPLWGVGAMAHTL